MLQFTLVYPFEYFLQLQLSTLYAKETFLPTLICT